jgi:tetratricopeptide (TPR) repeat protein
MHAVRFCALALLCVGAIGAQSDGNQELTQAYKLLAQKSYDDAIAAFRKGIHDDPRNAAAHKDLAYTLLKTGDNAEARDEFKAAIDINPHDETASLEYAFLCFETKRPVEARRTFDRLRTHGTSEATRQTAETAFENIDKPLAEGIARWKDAISKLPDPMALSTYSAHWELAQLAEQRDNLPLAAEQYEICRKLKPERASLLLDLARIWRQLNEREQAHAALLAASRSSDSRTAEEGLELLGARYPYVYEFQNAIRLDPKNINLRRELAFLYLELKKEPDAIKEFESVLAIAPNDKLSLAQLEALRHPRPATAPVAPPAPANRSDIKVDPKVMGMKSLAAGYINDAIRYLRIAHEDDPDDTEVMLKLGWAYNAAKNDAEAVKWFDAARHSSNSLVANEANKAWHNLLGIAPAQTTMWLLPMYSSRWNDTFIYGQAKRTLPIPYKLPVSFYLSARFVGDLRGQVQMSNLPPQYLSENAVIAGFGASTRQWHHLMGWAEAGLSMNYIPGRTNTGIAVPDYRGGMNFAKGFGQLLGSTRSGFFYETTADAIYVSRFDKDWLFYSQHRVGRTFRIGSETLQAYVNGNLVQDMKREYWANSLEFGPGTKLHLPWMPQGVYLSADWLRGVYTTNVDNPRRPNYNDFRLGFWYAATR